MTCIRYPDDDLVMKYVTGDLAEPDQSTFEDHLFTCDTCLARVERYQAAQQVLAARERPVTPTLLSLPDAPTRSGGWWMLAAAAMLLVTLTAGLGVWWRRGAEPTPQLVAAQPTPTPVPARPAPSTPAREQASTPGTSRGLQLAVLAMVTPPPYLPLTTRGEAEASRFAAGMAAYTNQDWTAAAEALDGQPAPVARFYRGIADLMRGELAGATTNLEAVRASDAVPYARESAFYLGKAALQRDDVEAARTWFTRAIGEGATTAKEATRLLAALDDLQGR